jgi:hypothetical protein
MRRASNSRKHGRTDRSVPAGVTCVGPLGSAIGAEDLIAARRAAEQRDDAANDYDPSGEDQTYNEQHCCGRPLTEFFA